MSTTISPEEIIRQIKISCYIPNILEAIVRERVINTTAEQLGIIVSEKELQEEGDNIRLTNKLVKAVDTWAWLEKHQLSLEDFEVLVRNRVITKKLAYHLFSGQVEKVFYENQVNFSTAITYEVLFNDRDIALEIFFAIQEGEITFTEIARQYIEEPELRRMGGYHGARYRTDFRPEVAPVVFAANPPEILKPINTAKGTYLIFVEEIIQPQLDESLRQQIINDLFNEWLQQNLTGAF
jgi:parvulin-like peptidyl-prolyl isomerase